MAVNGPGEAREADRDRIAGGNGEELNLKKGKIDEGRLRKKI